MIEKRSTANLMLAIRDDEAGPVRITCMPPRWKTAKDNTYRYYVDTATNVLVSHAALTDYMLETGFLIPFAFVTSFRVRDVRHLVPLYVATFFV